MAELEVRDWVSSTQTNTQSLTSGSAIGLHLLQNPTCAQHYDDSRFSILAKGRSPFHLSALEATFIKTSKPRPLPTKAIRVQLEDCALMTLSHWSFSSQSQFWLFSINSRSLSCALHSDDSSRQVSVCQSNKKTKTKSFKDMNILIKAILKFYTTNQLLNS